MQSIVAFIFENILKVYINIKINVKLDRTKSYYNRKILSYLYRNFFKISRLSNIDAKYRNIYIRDYFKSLN